MFTIAFQSHAIKRNICKNELKNTDKENNFYNFNHKNMLSTSNSVRSRLWSAVKMRGSWCTIFISFEMCTWDLINQNSCLMANISCLIVLLMWCLNPWSYIQNAEDIFVGSFIEIRCASLYNLMLLKSSTIYLNFITNHMILYYILYYIILLY